MKLKNITYLGLFFIILLYFIVIFLQLGQGSLADWDEAIYAEVSKEILETGNLLTLHYDFNPWFHKPPFLFYLVAITYKLIGISTFSSRIWPALFGLATVIITFFLAKKLFNNKVALISCLILLTSPQFLHKSRMLMLDIPVTFFIVFSLYLFLLIQEKQKFHYLLGISLGFGVMIKGPIGLLPIFIILLYLLLTKNIKTIINRNYLKPFLSFLIICLPWHLIQLIIHGSEFINNYFLYHILKKIVSAIDTHNYGNLFYFFVIKNGLYLWFYLLLISLFVLIYKRNKSNLFLLSWIIVISGIFLIAKTKLPWYLIPLYPAFAISISSSFYNFKIRKYQLGLFILIIVFLLSLHIPEPLFCNNFLKNVNIIRGEKLKVDNSIGRGPAELFYLGSERYDCSEIHDGGLCLSHCIPEEAEVDIIGRWGGYVLFAKGDYTVKEKTLELISKIPESQREPVRYCYAFMPMNLGIYYGKYLINNK